MGKSTFSGPIRTGKEGDGTVATVTLGIVPATQKTIVSGEATVTVARLPGRTVDILDFTIVADGAYNATANASTNFLFGDGTTDNLYGTISVSARGVYKVALGHANASALATGASNWLGASGTVVVNTSSAVTAAASGRAAVFTTYRQNNDQGW